MYDNFLRFFLTEKAASLKMFKKYHFLNSIFVNNLSEAASREFY